MKPGYEWDPVNRRYKPVDYLSLSPEELQERRDKADDRVEEVKAQVEAILPAAEASKLLHKGMEELQDLIITVAKKAPEVLLGII